MRAVIYARYFSENQSAASIDDQIRLCKERIAAALPHLKSSPAACAGGVRNEGGEHGNEGRIGRGRGRQVPAKRSAGARTNSR